MQRGASRFCLSTVLSLGLLATLLLVAAASHGKLDGHNLRGDFVLFSATQPLPSWLAEVFYLHSKSTVTPPSG